jgi:hypothetical protein
MQLTQSSAHTLLATRLLGLAHEEGPQTRADIAHERTLDTQARVDDERMQQLHETSGTE